MMFEQLIMVIAVLGGLLILLWVASNALKLELFPDVAKGFADVTTGIQEKIGGGFFNFIGKAKLGAVQQTAMSAVNLMEMFGLAKKEDPDWWKTSESWALNLNPQEFEAECAKYGINPYPEFSNPQVLSLQEKKEILALFPVEEKYELPSQLEKRAILKSEQLWA